MAGTVQVGQVPGECGGWRKPVEQTFRACQVIFQISKNIFNELLSSLHVFSELRGYLEDGSVIMGSHGKDIHEIIGKLTKYAKNTFNKSLQPSKECKIFVFV